MALNTQDAALWTEVLTKLDDPRLSLRWSYYSGDHPRYWLTTKLARMFSTLADRLIENWCGMAIGTRLNRLEVTGWLGDGAPLAQQTWDALRWAQRQTDLYRWSLVHGRGYVTAYPDPDGQVPVLAPNSAAWMYGIMDNDLPNRCYAAGKLIPDYVNQVWRGVLYRPDGTLDRLTGPAFASEDDVQARPEADEFFYVGGTAIDTGLGRCPVIPCFPYGSDAPPLLDQIAPIQDRINKLAANKFVAAEFSAFRQRVFFTRQSVEQGDVQQAPDWAIILDPGEQGAQTRVQELEATELSNYDNAKQAEVNSLFSIAALPRHLMVNPGATPSGEAIKADESPLIETLHDYQRAFADCLSTAMEQTGGLPCDPVWRDVEPHNDATVGQTVQAFVTAGVPWQEAVKRYAGWSDEDVAAAEGKQSAQGTQAIGDLFGLGALAPAPAPPL